MNKITLKSALFLMLFAAVFTSCEKEEDSDIPVITLTDPNPIVYDMIGMEYQEPGVSVSEGTLVVDKTALHMNKRGESKIYYSAIDDADNVGHAARTVIVKNPSEVMEGSFNVEVKNVSTGDIEDVYVDQLTQDDYINGKFVMSNFSAPCGLDKPIYFQYDWGSQSFNIISGQDIDGIPVENFSGNTFAVNFSGNTTFTMEITMNFVTRRYEYTKRNDPVAVAYVRVVHISSDGSAVDANPIDFYVDNEAVAPSIPYLANSNYVTTDAGNRSIKINRVASCTLQYSTITNNADNTNYTFFMLDAFSAIDLVKLQDDLSAPPGGQARVRFVNGAAGLPTNASIVDEDNGNNPLITDVGFKGNKTENINIGDYKFKLADNTNTPIPNSPGINIKLEEGKVYTVFSYIDENNQEPKLKIIVDK